MKIPEFKTKEDCTYWAGLDARNTKILPAGSFVKPIELVYLPEHVKDSTAYRWFDYHTDVFVYCSAGIVVIPKKVIYQV